MRILIAVFFLFQWYGLYAQEDVQKMPVITPDALNILTFEQQKKEEIQIARQRRIDSLRHSEECLLLMQKLRNIYKQNIQKEKETEYYIRELNYENRNSMYRYYYIKKCLPNTSDEYNVAKICGYEWASSSNYCPFFEIVILKEPKTSFVLDIPLHDIFYREDIKRMGRK